MTVAAEYLEMQVMTATPHRLHLMTVEAALRALRRGLEALDNCDWEMTDASFTRARDCLTELIGGLKPEGEPALIEPVKQLFVFAYRKIMQGELERNADHIRSAIRVLELHRETWIELGESLARSANPGVPQPHARSWLS